MLLNNKVKLIQWAADNFNELERLFGARLDIDAEALANFVPPQPEKEPGAPKPFSDAGRGKQEYIEAIERLLLPPDTGEDSERRQRRRPS